MVNYINEEWPCTPEEIQELKAAANALLELQAEIRDAARPHRLKVEWHEGLLAEVGIHGPGSVDKLFDSLPELPTEPLPPIPRPKLPAVPARLTRQPLPPVPKPVVDVDIPELPLDPLPPVPPTLDLDEVKRIMREFDVIAEKVRVMQPLEDMAQLAKRPEPGTPLHECEEPFNAPSYWWGVIGSAGLPVGDEPFTHVPDIDLYRKGIARLVGDLGDLTTSNNYDAKRNMNGSNWQGILTLYHQADGYDEPDYPYDEITPPVENVAAARFVIENNDNEAVVGSAAFSRKVIDDLFDTGKTYLDQYIKEGSTTPRRKF